MNVSVILVTYNSEKYINSCIESTVKALSLFQDYEIIVIDNNSLDDTIAIIEQSKNNKTTIIKQGNNKGYSYSINRALEKAKFEKILVLNPDIIIEKNSIMNLCKKIENPDIGIVGLKLLNLDGSFQLSSRRHFPTAAVFISYFFKLNKIFPKNRFFGKYNYTYLDENLDMEVDSISGACMVFTKTIHRLVDGFDENFFIYFEDTDFCIKIKNAGYKVFYLSKAEAVHCNDYSDNYTIKSFYFYDSLEKFIYKYKNKIYLGLLIYYLSKLINHIFYLKRRLTILK